MGIICLYDVDDNNRGFWLAPEFQGQGYMREASIAATDYWFNTLNKPVLRAPKAAANSRSRRISDSSGMRLIRTERKPTSAGYWTPNCGRSPATSGTPIRSADSAYPASAFPECSLHRSSAADRVPSCCRWRPAEGRYLLCQTGLPALPPVSSEIKVYEISAETNGVM